MTDAERMNLRYQLSARIVQHIADQQGMTPAEYGQVYDAEKHERLIVDLLRLVDRDRAGAP